MKTLGILGGMGPLAGCDLYRKIIEKTDARSDNEHIHVILNGNTAIPDRTSAILGGGKSPLPELIKTIKTLEQAGAEVLVISCNTAHYYYEEMQNCTSIPIINMINETANAAKQAGISRAGLLGTDATIKTGLYGAAMEKAGVDIITPSETGQRLIMSLIYDYIKSGRFDIDAEPLKKELADMQKRGAEAFVLACTELPIAFDFLSFDAKTLDPTDVLAEAAIRGVGGRVLIKEQ